MELAISSFGGRGTVTYGVDRRMEANAQLNGHHHDGPAPVAADPVSRELLDLATRVAGTDAAVMLTGESGVGKEVYARYLHDASKRSEQSFVAVNCAAIP